TRRILAGAEVEPDWVEDVSSAEHPALAALGGRTPAGAPIEDPASVKYKGAPRKLDLSRGGRGADARKAEERRADAERRGPGDQEVLWRGRGGCRGGGRGGGRGGARRSVGKPGRSGGGKPGRGGSSGTGRGRGRSGAPTRAPRRRGGR